VDEEIKKILKEAYDRAVEVLHEHRDGLDRVAEDLLEKEEVPGKEVLALVGVVKPQVPLDEVLSGSGSS
jgi:cell division protease FtsH